MSDADLLDFDEALATATKVPHVLLGNGFSVACRPDIFNYDNLLDQADLEERPEAQAAFERLGTSDFEVVIDALARAAELAGIYRTTDPSLSGRFRSDAEALKEVLIQTIAGTHPNRPAAITDAECAAAKSFLGNFKSKYLLNYDLLTYWALIRSEVAPVASFDDGFRQPENGAEAWVVWDSNRHRQDLFYLHGGLHIYHSGPEIRKFTWLNTGSPLMDQIRAALNDGSFPLYVAEGSWEDKLSRIRRSDFLGRALRSFKTIGGALFVYGMSMSENDDHILQAIAGGKIEQLFVSIYGDPNTDPNRATQERARSLVDRRASSASKTSRTIKVYFYDAESADVWGG